MHIRRIVAATLMAAATTAATAVPAQAGGKPYQAPEFIIANRLTAPTTVEFTYRCHSALPRTLVIELTAPGTDFYMKLKGRQVICDNKPQRYKAVLADPVDGMNRPLTPGETGRVRLGIYDGPKGDVLHTRLMTAH
ncbi:hypothetical protein AB0M57_21900 [Streptomyces sp. NPDC051597]|uniref:hypothetical protein n=1 Tax=Streptomyces sp. NPDC051597 TaxID=3155049 RepID=UPI00344913CF